MPPSDTPVEEVVTLTNFAKGAAEARFQEYVEEGFEFLHRDDLTGAKEFKVTMTFTFSASGDSIEDGGVQSLETSLKLPKVKQPKGQLFRVRGGQILVDPVESAGTRDRALPFNTQPIK